MKKYKYLLSFVFVGLFLVGLANLASAETLDSIYNKPTQVLNVTNWNTPVVASNFQAVNSGFLNKIYSSVKYTNCRRPVRAKIFDIVPNNATGTKDILIATSLNAVNSSNGGAFTEHKGVSWDFDSNTPLLADNFYVLQLESEDLGGNCFANFKGINMATETLTDLDQLKSDDISISEGGMTPENNIIFKGRVSYPNQAQLQVEIRRFEDSFTGLDDGGILKSSLVSANTVVEVSSNSLSDGYYKWRVRIVDEQSNASNWQEFGAIGNYDFEISEGDTSLFRENFNSYPYGFITSQPNWSARYGSPPHLVQEYFYNGPTGKGLWYNGNGQETQILLSNLPSMTDGILEFSIMCRGGSNGYCSHDYFALMEGQSGKGQIVLNNSFLKYHYDKEGNLSIIPFLPPELNQWQKVQMEWRSEDFSLRARGQNSSGVWQDWTDWGSAPGTSWNAIDGLLMYDFGNSDYVIDDIKVYPPTEESIKVAVVLAEPSDVSFEANHDKAYFENQILPNVKDYWCEVSFGERDEQGICSGGRVNLDFTIYDNNGLIYKLNNDQDYYGVDHSPRLEIDIDNDGNIDLTDDDRTEIFAWDTINLSDEHIDFNQYDSVVVVHPDYSIQGDPLHRTNYMTTQYWFGGFPLVGNFSESAKNWIIVSEKELTGVWAHELGHALGSILTDDSLCDLYGGSNTCGNIKKWGLMGKGSNTGNPSGSQPTHLASFSKLDLGWLQEEVVGYGNYEIESLETSNYGDGVKRYDIDDNSYYLLEARTNDSQYSNWDTDLPKDQALVVYKVKLEEKDGEVREIINIPLLGVITPSSVGYFNVLDNTLISPNSWISEASSFKVGTDITTANPTNLIGAVLKPQTLIYKELWDDNIPQNNSISSVSEAPMSNRFFLDSLIFWIHSDMHAYELKENLKTLLFYLVPFLVFSGLFRIIRKQKFSIFSSWPIILKRVIKIISLTLLIIAWLIALFLALSTDYLEPISNILNYSGILAFTFINALFLVMLFGDKHSLLKRMLIVISILVVIISLWMAIINIKYDFVDDNENRFEFDLPQKISQILLTGSNLSPDLDLHAITPNGQHTGMNYETGEYENQILGAIASGDLVYDDEWIFVPEGVDVKFYSSSYDIGQFLNENPDIAQELPSTQDQYDISAIYYDAQSQRYESQPLPSQIINPNENIVHSISGTTNISVLPGVVDDQAPIITHTPISSEYLFNSNPITFDFSSQDEGVGVFSLSAKLDGVEISSGDNISFNELGSHAIEIISEDFVGNIATKTIDFEVIYDFSGFSPPIKADGSGVYKLGRTLPIKFQLTDSGGQYISNAVAHLFTAKIDNGVAGTDEIPLSTSQADTDNIFRYDDTNNQYIYNLSTDTLSVGTWQIKIFLDDNREYVVIVSVK